VTAEVWRLLLIYWSIDFPCLCLAQSRTASSAHGDGAVLCVMANLASPCRSWVKMRKPRIEHWSGLAQRSGLTADMLNRQRRARSRRIGDELNVH